MTEVAGRTCWACTRSHIAEHTDAAAQARVGIAAYQGKGNHPYYDEQDIDEDKSEGTAYSITGDYATAELDGDNGTRMEL